MTQSPSWPASLTATIASQVKRIRDAQGMTAQQLADATAALRYAIPRSVIANLESGRRETVSVPEVLVLARALRVPPLVLIFPIGTDDAVEVGPGDTLDPWLAAKWFTGETPFPSRSADGEWTEDQRGLQPGRYHAAPAYFRDQEQIIVRWSRARQALAQARADAAHQPNAAAELDSGHYAELIRSLEEQLRYHRRVMRDVGLAPGELPAGLAHVDASDVQR